MKLNIITVNLTNSRKIEFSAAIVNQVDLTVAYTLLNLNCIELGIHHHPIIHTHTLTLNESGSWNWRRDSGKHRRYLVATKHIVRKSHCKSQMCPLCCCWCCCCIENGIALACELHWQHFTVGQRLWAAPEQRRASWLHQVEAGRAILVACLC